MSEDDPRPIETRLESAFDRYNRAVIAGMEPTAGLFIEALQAEGLRLSLSGHGALDAVPAVPLESEEPARGGSVPSAPGAGRLVPRRVRALL